MRSKILAINIGTKGFAEEFLHACDAHGIECIKVRAKYMSFLASADGVTFFHKGEPVDLSDIDYAFIRVKGRFPLATSLIAHVLKERGIPFNDDVHLAHTQNEEKITQMIRFALAGLPMPHTFIATREGFEENAASINDWPYPVVLKGNGSQGDAVWKIGDADALSRGISTLSKGHEMILVQEFVPNDFDIRALFVYGDCIGAIKRRSEDGFYNNVSKGGRAEQIELTKEECELGKRACTLLSRDFGGVDIVRSQNGPLLLEVNLAPQIHGFEAATGIDVPAAIVSAIARQTS